MVDFCLFVCLIDVSTCFANCKHVPATFVKVYARDDDQHALISARPNSPVAFCANGVLPGVVG